MLLLKQCQPTEAYLTFFLSCQLELVHRTSQDRENLLVQLQSSISQSPTEKNASNAINTLRPADALGNDFNHNGSQSVNAGDTSDSVGSGPVAG